MYTPAQFNQLSGTIPSGGSLSQVIDTEIFPLMGLILTPNGGTGTLVAGTVKFRVGVTPSTLYPVVDSTGTRIALTYSTTAVAFGFTAVQAIAPYRYVQIETSVNQTQAVRVILPVKV